MMGKRLENAKGLYLYGIRDGHPREAVARYTGDRYTQHSTGVRDGQEGFIEFFEPFIERNPSRDIQIVRGWEDGQYVFIHAYQDLNNGQAQWVTTDFFDTDKDGQIIEHWDVIAPYVAETPSGRTSVDGTTEITDLAHTEANKALVRAMIEDVLVPDGNTRKVAAYIAEDLVQHSATMADGRAAFLKMLEQPARPLYHEIVLLVGKGSFVATLCRMTQGEQEFAQVDLFRIADGLVVEHWENAEPVPPPEQNVNSGKF